MKKLEVELSDAVYKNLKRMAKECKMEKEAFLKRFIEEQMAFAEILSNAGVRMKEQETK